MSAPTVERNTYFITTAIAYPNGQPHIGHAYEAIATDALARFQRLDGKDVFFLTGTDEHGQKMTRAGWGKGSEDSCAAASEAGAQAVVELVGDGVALSPREMECLKWAAVVP